MKESLDLTIISLMAAAGGENEPMWRGNITVEVPDDLTEANRVAHINEEIFRIFNRIEEEDVRLLETVGYRLPSLSLGDVLIWGGRGYEVTAFGFRDLVERMLKLLNE